MKFISFETEKCDDCYKCLRSCPTKAIIIKEKTHDIDDNLCIKCGMCQEVCPQKALTIRSELSKVRTAIRSGKKIVASIAPSFVGAFDIENPLSVVTALRQLGFNHVEETGIGAELVSTAFNERLQVSELPNLITSCCPSANYLIEQYYPELTPYILPYISPMVAHGKLLRRKYGTDAYVVFIGPCMAKKAEAEEFQHCTTIDAVLTFEELDQWLAAEQIDLNALEPTPFCAKATKRGGLYPTGSSLLEADLKTRFQSKYKITKVNGIDNCIELLDAMKSGHLDNYCVEMCICNNSCLSGPGMPRNIENSIERKIKLHNYVDNLPYESDLQPILLQEIPLHKSFFPKEIKKKTPTKEELWHILNEIGKTEEADLLNCSACGYRTCYDKAEAVYNGMSDVHMCLPYLRDKAESLRTTIFNHSPNLIVIVDKDYMIKEANPAFRSNFIRKDADLRDLPITLFMPSEKFEDVFASEENILRKKYHYSDLQKTFFENLIYLEDEEVILCIMMDITAVESKQQELMRVKEQTLSSCQEVINKQMRVAQEIASLLGETTAETKVNLNRLKDLVIGEEDKL
ncbi:MAG: 4Fe-4S binding protein [Clostridia bacterium]|nr:4Fe-4S binding protein [Clostridia bacterium]